MVRWMGINEVAARITRPSRSTMKAMAQQRRIQARKINAAGKEDERGRFWQIDADAPLVKEWLARGDLPEDLEEARTRLKRITEACDEWKHRCEQLEKNLEKARTRLKRITEACDEWKHRCEQLEKENEKLRKAMKTTEDRKPLPIMAAELAMLAEDYVDGCCAHRQMPTIVEFAGQFNAHPSTVGRHLKQAGIDYREWRKEYEEYMTTMQKRKNTSTQTSTHRR